MASVHPVQLRALRGAWPSRLMNNALRRRAGRRAGAAAEEGAGSDDYKMAALKEARSYGLSCGRVSDGSRVSVFHVKLTDSALKAFESYRAHQVSGAASWRADCAVGTRPRPHLATLGQPQ